MRLRALAAAPILLLFACARSTDAPDAAATTPAPLASAAPSVDVPHVPPPDPAPADAPPDPAPARPAPTSATRRLPGSTVEARRTTLRRLDDDRALAGQRDAIRAHFGGAVPAPLELQTATLSGDHRAVLLTGGPKNRAPLVLVFDASGALLWTKERPLAGIDPSVVEIVVLPGPDGGVALAWFDKPTHLVALRTWDAEGGILADFQVLDVASCDALSGLYWPGYGWLLIAAQPGPARAQLLGEAGTLAWGAAGRELAWTARPAAPVSAVLDTDDSVMLLQVGRAFDAKQPSERLWIARFSGTGASLWAQPIDLGPAPPASTARISATQVEHAIVRVAPLPGSPRPASDVTAMGTVVPASSRR